MLLLTGTLQECSGRHRESVCITYYRYVSMLEVKRSMRRVLYCCVWYIGCHFTLNTHCFTRLSAKSW